MGIFVLQLIFSVWRLKFVYLFNVTPGNYTVPEDLRNYKLKCLYHLTSNKAINLALRLQNTHQLLKA